MRRPNRPDEPPSPVALVEGQPQPDGVEPGPDVSPVEPVPGAVGAQVRLLRQVARTLAIADDQRQPPDQPGVVRRDRIGEVVGR